MPNTLLSHNRKTNAFAASEKGFSLVELLIGIMIFLIVTGAIYGLLQVGLRSRSNTGGQVQLNKNVRLSLNLIGRDTYNAGHVYPLKNSVRLPNNRLSPLLGIPADPDSTADLLPPVIAGNNVMLNTASGNLTDQVTFLFKDSTFNVTVGPTGVEESRPLNIPKPTTVGGIDQIVPLSGSNSACTVNDIYIITGNTGSTLGVATALSGGNTVRFANGDPLGFNLSGASGQIDKITTPASMQRIRMITYFVTADGTLMRRDYANVLPAQNWVDQPIVYGVENFQIKYVMDNGTLTDNPSQGPDGVAGTADDDPTKLSEVRQIRFTVNAKSEELDPSGQPYRAAMTTTYATRNLGYKGE